MTYTLRATSPIPEVDVDVAIVDLEPAHARMLLQLVEQVRALRRLVGGVMDKWIVRQFVEHSIEVEAETEDQAIEKAMSVDVSVGWLIPSRRIDLVSANFSLPLLLDMAVERR